jgi:hypothetical protein
MAGADYDNVVTFMEVLLHLGERGDRFLVILGTCAPGCNEARAGAFLLTFFGVTPSRWREGVPLFWTDYAGISNR